MKKSSLTAFLCILLLFLLACQKKEAVPKQIPQAEPQKVAFVPPPDSSVKIEQMKKWILCNSYLDSLSILYKDSFAVNDAARQTRYQENFLKAQDMICVRVGLSGGYTEYLWVLKSIGNPRNAKILDSLKLTVYK